MFLCSISCDAQKHKFTKSIKTQEHFVITKHKHGFDFSFDSNTDVLFDNKFFGCVAAHWKHNLGYTLFANSTGSSLFADIATQERGVVEMYFLTDEVTNTVPSVTAKINSQNNDYPSDANAMSLRNGDETKNSSILASNLIASVRNSQVSTTTTNVINNYDNLNDVMNRTSTTRFANYQLGGSIISIPNWCD